MKNTAIKFAGIIGIIILATVIGGGLLAGCRHGSRFHEDPEVVALRMKKGVDRALSKLNATDAQKEEIHEITEALLEDALLVKQRARKNYAGMTEIILADDIDREKLHEQLDSEVRIMTEFAHRTAEKLADISAILTPEQRGALLKYIDSKRQECL